MPNIIRSPDCGHSPKNKLLEQLAIARVTVDVNTIADLVSDDIQWTKAGEPPVSGLKNVIEAMKDAADEQLVEVTVFHVTQHGKVGAVNGRLKLRSGDLVEFCDMCVFANTKGTAVKEIVSYAIRSE